jgi:hypothetical protein
MQVGVMPTPSESSTVPVPSGSPACAFPPRPLVIQAFLSLAWRHPRPERPDWLRSEVGDSIHSD